MAMNYVPLDKAVHKDLKLSTQNNFAFTQNTHLAAASIREFARAPVFRFVFGYTAESAHRTFVVADGYLGMGLGEWIRLCLLPG